VHRTESLFRAHYRYLRPLRQLDCHQKRDSPLRCIYNRYNPTHAAVSALLLKPCRTVGHSTRWDRAGTDTRFVDDDRMPAEFGVVYRCGHGGQAQQCQVHVRTCAHVAAYKTGANLASLRALPCICECRKRCACQCCSVLTPQNVTCSDSQIRDSCTTARLIDANTACHGVSSM
jgi:hypothetical protein